MTRYRDFGSGGGGDADGRVIDIRMPDVNGHEIAERIRHEACDEQITLTAWGQTALNAKHWQLALITIAQSPSIQQNSSAFFSRHEFDRSAGESSAHEHSQVPSTATATS